MPKNFFTITKRPPKASKQYKAVRDEVRVGLNRVGKQIQLAFKRVVSNWRNKPGFGYQVGSGPRQLFLRVHTTGSKKAKRIWDWIDKTGTKPHIIRPKRAKFLRFERGGEGSYIAKTGANPARFGGPGIVKNGRIVYAKQVRHPGFKPREFGVAILKDAMPRIEKEIRNGYRRGLRRAKRG